MSRIETFMRECIDNIPAMSDPGPTMHDVHPPRFQDKAVGVSGSQLPRRLAGPWKT